MKTVISTAGAPAAIGPYSQGIAAKGLVFVSGQLPLDPESGVLVDGDIAAQTERALLNVKAVLEEAGSCLENVVKATVYLKDMEDFAGMNEVYKNFFGDSPPARAAFQVARLPKDAMVEIEVIALVGGEDSGCQ